MTTSGLVCIGRSSGAFGLKGELRVFSYAEDPHLYNEARLIFIGADPKTSKPYQVVSSKEHGQRLLLRLEGVASREQADELKGLWLYIPKDSLPQVAEDEYYWHQAEGSQVIHKDGRSLGKLIKVSNAGAHDLWLIRGDTGKEALFPVVPDFISQMDLEAGQVEIDPPEGLFEAQGFWEEDQESD